jgi:hypothetical protein
MHAKEAGCKRQSHDFGASLRYLAKARSPWEAWGVVGARNRTPRKHPSDRIETAQERRRKGLPVAYLRSYGHRVRLFRDGKTIAMLQELITNAVAFGVVADNVSREPRPDRLADQKSGLLACGIGSRF